MQSPFLPAEVKAAIRSRKKGWFHRKDGARGWIVGPFICLWFSALDRYGPMLFGRVARTELGTRITGRAGSDLNGLAMFTVMIAVMPLLLYKMVSAGDYTSTQLIIPGGLVLFSPLIFWWSHKDRRQAEPLVRFLRDTVTGAGRDLRAKSSKITLSKALTLNVAGENLNGPVTPDAIHDALLAVGAGGFVILLSAPENYIQTAFRDGGYVLEKREGCREQHFEAKRRSATTSASNDAKSALTFEEVREAFVAYASEGATPPFLRWERMHLGA
jgi:hypothetical protein